MVDLFTRLCLHCIIRVNHHCAFLAAVCGQLNLGCNAGYNACARLRPICWLFWFGQRESVCCSTSTGWLHDIKVNHLKFGWDIASGTNNSDVSVRVTVPPRIYNFPSVTAEEGQPTKLVCLSQGDPSPDLTFQPTGHNDVYRIGTDVMQIWLNFTFLFYFFQCGAVHMYIQSLCVCLKPAFCENIWKDWALL